MLGHAASKIVEIGCSEDADIVAPHPDATLPYLEARAWIAINRETFDAHQLDRLMGSSRGSGSKISRP